MVTTSTRRDAEPLITAVIPVLNDTAALASLLPTLPVDSALEIIVVDGGEACDPAMDGLRERYSRVTWMRSAPGRGVQMNQGARRACGRWLLFLHADTRLGVGWIDLLRRLDEQPRIVGGSFRFALDSPARWARWIEWGVRIRVRLLDLAFGDQALFVRRTVFEELEGYKELPLMEDVDFIRRLRRRGRLKHADVPALTSARRWERDGWLQRSLENSMLVALFLAGRPPERLARRYDNGADLRAERAAGPHVNNVARAIERACVATDARVGPRAIKRMRPVIAIMARAPSSEGKSRLIGELGTRDGAGLRLALLRDTLESVSALQTEKAMLYTPPDCETEIRALTPFPAVFLPQRGTTLGERMRDGIRDLLSSGFGAVVLIGSDLPTLPSTHVSAALDMLTPLGHRLVLGPAEDGGYYLIGLTESHPELFERIPWGTPLALQRTREAAEALGIPVETLPRWYDVDSPLDLRRLWRDSEQLEGARYTRAWLAAAPPEVRARVET